MKRILLLCLPLLSGCLSRGGGEAPAPAGALACVAGEMERLGYLVIGSPEGEGVRGEKETYLGPRRSLARLTALVARDPARGTLLRVEPERWEDRGLEEATGDPRGLPPGIGGVLGRPRPGNPAAGPDSAAARRMPRGYRRTTPGPVAMEARQVLHTCSRPGAHPQAVAD